MDTTQANQALRHAVENLLANASFNYDEGDTRKLISEVNRALVPQAGGSPVTFYYNVRAGGYRKNRRSEVRLRTPVPN